MTNDPNPALRAELQAALDVLTPQIRGLKNFAKTSMSPDALTDVNAQITARSHRSDLIIAVLAALDAVVAALVTLDADGYPDLPKTQIIGSIFAEIQEQAKDLDIAAAVFQSTATAIGLDIPGAVHTLQPTPAA